MERLVFLSLMFVASALSLVVDPRGARPVQPATRSEKCATEKEWPFCTSDNWGPKCPSGCRIQGLMDKDDHDLLKKIEKIRSLLEQNKANYRNADHHSKETFTILRERLTIDADHDNNYYDLAQNLRQRITDMKIKIDRQLSVLAALKDRVKDQVVEMQRLEVDIDIKLRSCKGSCQSYSEYSVDKDSYVELDKQINQLDAQSGQRIESVGSLSVMKSRLLKDSSVETLYKSKDTTVAAQQREDMFPDVNTVQLILEEEGSSSSPATISKVPGTSLSSSASSSSSIPSSSSASSSSSSSTSTSTSMSSKSITELGGGDFSSLGGVSTSHITCTKRTRTTTIHTKDGPVEKTEEVIEGGPECQSLADHFTGGTSSLSHTSSSSSSSTTMTKTVHSGDAKGSLLGDTKTGFGDLFGSDVGGFLTDAADDDLPDFHARSLTNTRTERHADYIGKGTKTSDLE
ncbi:fibrinogen alpha chain-like [Epinephelus fuscoguttatus]|uniref:fibrinogen alpha chain-like n=1 Tax=Epinephelus fuscoguttatus TaxID=293821 RepID=UPI0020D05409|nr:fibrinogen alpha chain-like [Epinephelus fuscoguttatus]